MIFIVQRTAFVVAGLLVAGCTAAAPLGFSQGEHWTLPLVGPLEGGTLLVPCTVNGQGPYLFLIDPDAPTSVIDQQVIEEAKLEVIHGPTRVDEAGEAHDRGYALIENWKLGDLSIDRRQVMAVPSDFYNLEGRHVNGVIGRDVISDRLTFGLDRDQGVVTLATEAVFKPQADATVIDYDSVVALSNTMRRGNGAARVQATDNDDPTHIGMKTSREASLADVAPVPRRVAIAAINGAQVKVHLDFGAPVSQLREDLWPKAKLTAAVAQLRLIDEVASVRVLDRAAPADVTLFGANGHSTFVPYIEQRFASNKVAGSLGLDFFRGYTVFAHWSDEKLYLRPRGDREATAVARIGRWGAAIPKCAHPGCVSATVTTTTLAVKLDIQRDPEAPNLPIEVYLGVTPAEGHHASNLIAELPANAASITGAVPLDYQGALLTVLDASPYLRPCDGPAGCVFDAP